MNRAQTLLKPRKSPVQARSAVTVEALHAATIQVLIGEGLSRCTTTRIAERAGTSVGSLYQYYPNRDALLAAVLAKHLTAIAVAVERTCLDLEGQPISRMASALVHTFVGAKMRDPEEAKALYGVAEERDGSIQAARMRNRIIVAMTAMLESASDAGFDDSATVAAIALGALMGPIQMRLKDPVSTGLGNCLEMELTTLVMAYLHASQRQTE